MSEKQISINLSSLLELSGIAKPDYGLDSDVLGIVSDSRKVKEGYLFVACSGDQFDGHDFIQQAIQAGAAAVIGTRQLQLEQVPYIQVEDSRKKFAHLAAAFYDFPARKMAVIGVTGTDGKTTTSNLIYHILNTAGVPAGMISTVNAVIGSQSIDTGFHVTTPDAVDVQRYLSLMHESGLTHAILETTSHGLAQYRVEACGFDIGVVTNVTHEHLDYHGNYQNYLAAKGRMFSMLGKEASKNLSVEPRAVLNFDDQSFEYLSAISPVPQISYGLDKKADYHADHVQAKRDSTEFVAVHRNGKLKIYSPLTGNYNVSNCLAALAVCIDCLGIDAEIAAQAIRTFPGVPGRMERIDLGQQFNAIVDFAHTPNGLKRVLEAARDFTSGRIIAIFGSAGLRDREKRRMMAEISVQLADLTILTAEDPRTESLGNILEEMAEGAEAVGGKEGVDFIRIPDRGNAIRYALKQAQPEDSVLACGKGHEQSMCFGSVEYAWDDRTAMRAALSEYLGLSGPEMPYLPTREK